MSENKTPYIVQNPRPSRPVPPIPTEQLTDYPWFIPSCLNRTDATQILKSCLTIENGNFLVRYSENQTTKYTVSLWFDKTTTHVRINQLPNGRYQLQFQPNSNFQMPTFPTIQGLIDFFSDNEMKLIGHCQGFVKLKFNSNILNYIKEQGGICSYGS